MAIDQHGGPEVAMHARDQPPQRAMIRLVERFYPPQGFINREPLAVDFLRVTHNARDGAEPARYPHRARIGKGGQAAIEHARVELVGLAVDVDIAAREMRTHQRVSAFHHAQKQLVDERILGAPQRREIEPRGDQKVGGIDPPTMRRIENDRAAPFFRLENFEGRIELIFWRVHSGGGLRRALYAVLASNSCISYYPPDRCWGVRSLKVHAIFTPHSANGWPKAREGGHKPVPCRNE